MKNSNIIKFMLLGGIAALGLAAGCAREPFEEIKELSLSRCLEPMNLSERVNSLTGTDVTFSWDVNKDAESYTLEVYNDEAMTELIFSQEGILPEQVPYERKVEADRKLYFRVKAVSSKRDDSKWAEYKTNVRKTFAVMDNLFLTVTARTKNSITLSWSNELADYNLVDHIEYGAPGSDEVKTYTLTTADIDAASATVTGEGDAALLPATEYEMVLYYKTAPRGQVNVWTMVDPAGMTEVSTVAALQNALTTPDAKIYLKMAGSPYQMKTQALNVPVSIYGESADDGSKPVILGEFELKAPLTSGDWLFEDVQFDGDNDTYGFVIQLDKKKSDFASAAAKVGNITFRNCVINGYSKGLIYEWDQTYDAGELTFESCDITNINVNFTGGDVIDLRKASKFQKIALVNNTIINGGRTWLRIDASPTVEELRIENNTILSTGYAYNEGSYSFGFMGLQSTPGTVIFQNNLILNQPADSRFGSDKANYKYATELTMTAKNNWYYNVPDDYFSDNYPVKKLGFTKLSVDPCFNSKGGYLNLDPDSDISGMNVGASKWWTPLVEKPEDLTMTALPGAKVWNFGNASLFTEKIKREMVREGLYINASDNYAFEATDNMLHFTTATSVNKKNLPLEGYLAFMVNTPGSILVKPVEKDGKPAHILVGVGPIDHTSVTIKGGASPLADQGNVQKILVKGIVDETMVYVWSSGPISLAQLAWSTDVTPVNTALAAPAPTAAPAVVTARESTPVTVSWDAVSGAASYTVIFGGKTYPVEETTYTIPGGTVSMLDPGSYKVEVYANPGADDIYNTESPAGVAAFAVLSAGGEAGGALVVKTIEELNNAILAGKSEITLAAGTFDLGERDVDGNGEKDGSPILTVTAPLSLTGQDGAVILGGFKLSGDAVGTFSLKNLTVNAEATKKDDTGAFNLEKQGVLIDLDNSEGVKADAVIVENVVMRNFQKSVIYASNNADKFDITTILFKGLEVYDMGTGQGVFDLRNGKYGTLTVEESTVVGGRDFLRADATLDIDGIYIRRNTFYKLNDAGNGNGIFYARCTPKTGYVVSYNLIASISNSVAGKTGAATIHPAFAHNFYYDIAAKFYTGAMTEEETLTDHGVVLTENPFKDAPNGDFTLVNALAQSCGVGAPKWNPAAYTTPASSFTVKSAEEFASAIEAGKTDIHFAAGEYTLGDVAIVPGMRLSGESGAVVNLLRFAFSGDAEELGTLVFENLDLRARATNDAGDAVSNSLFDANTTTVKKADRLIIRNCTLDGVKNSIFYGNGDNVSIGFIQLSNLLVTNKGTGQGTVDIRKGTYKTVTVEDCTIVGGRDFIRADAGKVTDAVIIRNNIFDGCCLNNGNGILYVRSTPANYQVYNNLFLNENGANNPLGKATGVTVPTFSNNHFFNCTAANFWTTAFTEELAKAGNGSILADNPCPNAASGDYTLANEDLKKADVGPARWNPSAPVLRVKKNARKK